MWQILKTCQECREEEARDEDFICPYIKADDNLPLRCVGKWSRDKLYCLGKYMNVFNTAMKYRWPKRAYIDLFAGPGKCIIRESREIVSGSTLLALEQTVPFSLVVSVDINSNAISALEKRAGGYKSETRLKTFQADCNLIADWIRQEVDLSYLTLVLIDPTSMQIKFSTINELTEDLRMDLIINYPLQAINRSYKDAMGGNDEVFNDYFGTDEWKGIILKQKSPHNIATRLLPLYKKQLAKIGYIHTDDLNVLSSFQSDEILVKGPRNIPLYYLFLASKDPLGNKLWQEIKKIRPDRQGQFI